MTNIDKESGINDELDLIKCLKAKDVYSEQQIKDVVFDVGNIRSFGNKIMEQFFPGKCFLHNNFVRICRQEHFTTGTSNITVDSALSH